MNDAAWGNETEAPKKKSVWKWIFIGCGGCAVLLAIANALAFVAGRGCVEGMRDAEKQLPELRSAIEFDPLPPETHFEIAMRFPLQYYLFRDDRGYVLSFIVLPPGDRADMRDKVMSPDFGMLGMERRRDARDATVVVQGRELKGMRCIQKVDTGDAEESPSIMLDVTAEDGKHAVFVQIVRTGGEAEISDEDVRALLRPFHVGPDR